ncbi:hypothetical protein HGRIS_003677 [Hohenbuehelia grisea]|uniref:Protoheme IX farnesyltransferase, mitochondrial n=1 Tax=Hohenbuehelia grisea TaxID=104357 RepID=A0ABR3JG64_9AGAR
MLRGLATLCTKSTRASLANRRYFFTATVSNPTFTSFFYHNTQWANNPSSSSSATRRIAHALPNSTVVAVPENISAYKPAEAISSRALLKSYAQLSKARLSILVTLTAMSGVALSPLPITLPILFSTAIGTALCSASANTLNQLQEVPFDAQMARTRTRPLVRRAISPLHATAFAVVTGIAGPALLWTMVNPITAVLGASNIVLYAGVYTWLKRRGVINTWVGAVVGGLPPLMGWTACGGKLLPSQVYPPQIFLPSFLSPESLPSLDVSLVDNPVAPLALFILCFCWQFPHFNALSYVVRGSYAQAGFRMLSVVSPPKNALVALRHSALLLATCSFLIPLSGLTTWAFALTSLFPNLIITRAAYRFWQRTSEKEAKVLFQHCLWYLPVILGLMMVHKQGMDWQRYVGFKSDAVKDEDKRP